MQKRGVKKAQGPSNVLKWGCFAAAIFALFAVLGDQGLLRLRQVRDTEKRLDQMIEHIQSENDKLSTEAQLMRDDKYLEKVIREELGYLRPDEVVYYLESR